eukprot:4441367-Alexandrium_andersonii.AAC.1
MTLPRGPSGRRVPQVVRAAGPLASSMARAETTARVAQQKRVMVGRATDLGVVSVGRTAVVVGSVRCWCGCLHGAFASVAPFSTSTAH